MAAKGRNGTDYILMEHSFPDGSGHYGMTRVNHNTKNALIYDSMKNEDSDFEDPLKSLLGKGYKVSSGTIHGCYPRLRNASSTDLNPQPTGGFVSQSFTEFKNKTYAGGRGVFPRSVWKKLLWFLNMMNFLNITFVIWSHSLP